MGRNKPKSNWEVIDGGADKPCEVCEDLGWLCQEHLHRPMGHDGCTGAGMPCDACNVGPADSGMRSDLVVELILDDAWRSADEISFEISERRRPRTGALRNRRPVGAPARGNEAGRNE